MEERIARICYNEYGWARPSGPNGKSKGENLYENDYGFGHEEWLFDRAHLLDGYHYSYLESVNRDYYQDKIFDIHLFTISKDFGKFYLGIIHNVECLNKKSARWATKEYKKLGWLDEMKQDVKTIGGKTSGLSKDAIFNIRFRLSDMDINLSNPRILSPSDPNTKNAKRYSLYKKKGDFVFDLSYAAQQTEGRRKATDSKSEKRVAFNTDFRRTEYDPIHNKIQNALKQILTSTGEYKSVELENPVLINNSVDIVGITKKEETHFYEVKTSSAKKSIREAIGQILEYAYYPNENRADKLIIVAPEPADEYDLKYLQRLRSDFGIPVWFRYYSFADNSLSELL